MLPRHVFDNRCHRINYVKPLPFRPILLYYGNSALWVPPLGKKQKAKVCCLVELLLGKCSRSGALNTAPVSRDQQGNYDTDYG